MTLHYWSIGNDAQISRPEFCTLLGNMFLRVVDLAGSGKPLIDNGTAGIIIWRLVIDQLAERHPVSF